MKLLSTGKPSTLGTYRDFCADIYGSHSPSTEYFNRKIKQAPNGRREEVLQDEGQVVQLVLALEAGHEE